MNKALQQAELAYRKQEVPIGAVVVLNKTSDTDVDRLRFELIAVGHNLVESTHDASAHAEMVALRRAAKRQRNWRLHECILFSTIEPCPTCLSAAQAFRISELVYGAPDLRLGAVKTHLRLVDDYRHPFHDLLTVTGDIMGNETAHILKSFFRERREKR